MATPHVLVIPSWYPTREDPIMGIFFQEQAEMVQAAGIQIGVIYPEVRPLKSLTLSLSIKNYFQSTLLSEGMLPTARMHGWNLYPGYLKGTMHYWKRAALRLFERYIRERGMPDLVHAQSALWAGVAAKAIQDRYQVPYLLTEHRDNFLHERIMPHLPAPSWLDQVMGDVFSKSAQVIAVSHALKKGLMRYLKGSNREIQVIPNFLDMDYFAPTPEPKKEKPFTYLTLAHLVKSKNIASLLKAFQQLLHQDPDSVLKVGGDGPERRTLEQLAHELGIQKQVLFLGKLNRAQVKEAFEASHVFVLPSHYETFGVVFIEALAMGIPVIGTRCGGPEEIICPEMGELISPDDIEELTQSMLAMRRNYGNFPSHRLREYAIQRFSKQIVVKQILEIYRDHS